MKINFIGLTIVVVLLAAASAWSACNTGKPTTTPTSRFVVKGGEVYDTKTNLTWSRCSVGQHWDGKGCGGAVKMVTWEETPSLASAGWRMPTRDELATLTTPACRSPAINEEVFPGMDTAKLGYWTGSEYAQHYGWVVHFADDNDTFGQNRARKLAVRLVRSGK